MPETHACQHDAACRAQAERSAGDAAAAAAQSQKERERLLEHVEELSSQLQKARQAWSSDRYAAVALMLLHPSQLPACRRTNPSMPAISLR